MLQELKQKYMVKASDTLTIDLKKIADKMLENGLSLEDIKKDDLGGWTDGLVDALEEVYELETKLSSIFQKMPK
jgi:hypothetical protein